MTHVARRNRPARVQVILVARPSDASRNAARSLPARELIRAIKQPRRVRAQIDFAGGTVTLASLGRSDAQGRCSGPRSSCPAFSASRVPHECYRRMQVSGPRSRGSHAPACEVAAEEQLAELQPSRVACARLHCALARQEVDDRGLRSVVRGRSRPGGERDDASDRQGTEIAHLPRGVRRRAYGQPAIWNVLDPEVRRAPFARSNHGGTHHADLPGPARFELLQPLRNSSSVPSAPRHMEDGVEGDGRVAGCFVQAAEGHAPTHTAERLYVTKLREAAGVSD